MVFHMKTTLIIDDRIFRAIKEKAARDGTTISAQVETALRLLLRVPSRPRELKPLPSWSLGLRVNVDDRDVLYRAMEEGDDEGKR
jgi:hypothetical protein